MTNKRIRATARRIRNLCASLSANCAPYSVFFFFFFEKHCPILEKNAQFWKNIARFWKNIAQF